METTPVAPIRNDHVNLDLSAMGAAATKKSEKRATDGAVSRLRYTESTFHEVYTYWNFYVQKFYII